MNNQNQEPVYRNNVGGVLAGVLIGGLVGAVTMLLVAPQSGEETRSQLQEKGIELRDQATEMLENVVAQVRSDGNKLAVTGRQKAEGLLQQGQSLVADQLDHISEAAQAGKKVIQKS